MTLCVPPTSPVSQVTFRVPIPPETVGVVGVVAGPVPSVRDSTVSLHVAQRIRLVVVGRHAPHPEVVVRSGIEPARNALFLVDHVVRVVGAAGRVAPVIARLALLDLVGGGVVNLIPFEGD